MCTFNDRTIFLCFQLQLSQPLTTKQLQRLQPGELRAGPPLHQRLQVRVFTLPSIIWSKMERARLPVAIYEWWNAVVLFSVTVTGESLAVLCDAPVSCSCTPCSSEQSAKAKTQKELFKTLKEMRMHFPLEKRKSSTLNTLKYALRCVKQVKGKPSSHCSCVKTFKTLDLDYFSSIFFCELMKHDSVCS